MNLDSPKRRSGAAPRLRTRIKEATTHAILDAAEAVFTRDGVQRSRMEDVAAEAGVAVGTIYNHFADRDALVQALLGARRHELLARLDEALSDAIAPFEHRLQSFLSAVVAHFRQHSGLFNVHMETEVMQRNHGKPGKRAVPALLARASELVQEGVAAGVLRPEDASLYPNLLVGMLRGLFMQPIYGVGAAPEADAAQGVLRMFLQGAGRGARKDRR